MNEDPNREMLLLVQMSLAKSFNLNGLTEVPAERLGIITSREGSFKRIGFLHICLLPALPEAQDLEPRYKHWEVNRLPLSEILTPSTYDGWSKILATFIAERQLE
jgi:hypothetical protein